MYLNKIVNCSGVHSAGVEPVTFTRAAVGLWYNGIDFKLDNIDTYNFYIYNITHIYIIHSTCK